MKKVLCKAAFLSLLIPFTLFSNNTPAFAAGLAASYTFSGNANDESGNGNNGTVSGAVLTQGKSGAANSAYSFDGVNDYIQIPNFGSFTQFTVDALVKRTGATSARESIISYKEGSPTNCGFTLSLNENGSSQFPRLWVNVGGWKYAEGTSAIPLDSFVHIAGSYDGSTIKLYVDGQLAASTAAAGAMAQCTQVTDIGARAATNTRSFPGIIDNVAIYDSALSASEIQASTSSVPDTLDFSASAASSLGLQCDGTGLSAQCTLMIAKNLGLAVLQNQVTDLGGNVSHPSYKFTGAVEMITPLKTFTLFEATISVKWLDALGRYEVWGRAQLPHFDVPILNEAHITGNLMVMLGVVTRDTLIDLFGPDETGMTQGVTGCSEKPPPSLLLVPDIPDYEGYYMFFHTESNLSLEVGLSSLVGITLPPDTDDPLLFKVGNEQSFTLIIDPTNPYIYITLNAVTGAIGDNLKATLVKKTKSTTAKDADELTEMLTLIKSVAFSARGGLQFAPQTAWGLTDIDKAGEFKGQLYIEGTIPIEKILEESVQIPIPLTIEGDIMMNAGLMGGKYLGEDFLGVEVGLNGTLLLTLPYTDYIPFPNIPLLNSVKLGAASGGVKVGIERIGDGVKPDVKVYVSGMMCPNENFPLGEATLLLPKANSAMNIAMYFDTDSIEDTRIHMAGEFTVDPGTLLSNAGINLGDIIPAKGDLIIDKNGLLLTATTQASILPDIIQVEGDASLTVSITAKDLAGSYVEIGANINIYGVGLKNATQRIGSDGYHINGELSLTGGNSIVLRGGVTSSGVDLTYSEGVNIPMEWFDSVTQWVTDASVCGYTTVTDSATCGFETVTSVAICGADMVANAVECGWDFITNVSCGEYCFIRIWSICILYLPTDCEVPSTCEVAKSCDQIATCDTPGSCDQTTDVLKTGNLSGTLTLTLNSSGFKGKFYGRLLGVGSVSAEGTAEVTKDGKVCVAIVLPGGVGKQKVCTQ